MSINFNISNASLSSVFEPLAKLNLPVVGDILQIFGLDTGHGQGGMGPISVAWQGGNHGGYDRRRDQGGYHHQREGKGKWNGYLGTPPYGSGPHWPQGGQNHDRGRHGQGERGGSGFYLSLPGFQIQIR